MDKDKQIIERLKTDLDFERTKRKTLQAELQAKEQECEELKKQLTILDDEDVTVQISQKQFEEYNQLKAENERLKQAFAESDNDCFRLEKENRLLKIYRSIIPLKVKKLVQTLDEIKELAEKPITTIQYADGQCYGFAEWSELRGKCALARQILNKIDEVDDESYLDNHWLFTKEKGEN